MRTHTTQATCNTSLLQKSEKVLFKKMQIKAIFPTITSEATLFTMNAYRMYIDKYNREVRLENEEILKYNATVPKKLEGLSTFKETRRLEFMLANGKWRQCNGVKKFYRSREYTQREWNTIVEDYNELWGKQFRKELLQPVRSSSEAIFRQILYAYSLQLQKHTYALEQFGIVSKTPIKGVLINAKHIAQAQRNGLGVLNLCSKTIRNHRQRLQEAGVLENYQFVSSTKGVELEINPEILHIFDKKTGKIITCENQPLTAFKWKVLPHIYNDSYKNIKNKEEIKENVNNNSQNNASEKSDNVSTLELSSEKKELDKPNNPNNLQEQTLQEHPEQRVKNVETKRKNKKTRGGRAKFRDITPPKVAKKRTTPEIAKLSEMLTARIEDLQQFCKDLSNGFYDDYKPLDIRVLDKEAYRGLMSRDDFHELIIQEMLKQSAKIWKNKNVHIGSWVNAYNTLKDRYFIHYSGKPFHKNHQTEILGEYRWRLDHARKWFLRHKNFMPLFPSQYFDRERKKHQEGGFEWTRRAWQQKIKYESNKPVRKATAEYRAKLRAERINAHKSISFKISQYLANKIDISALYDFVFENHSEYIEHIGAMINQQILTK